jgi:hypothetical protein
MERAIGLHAVFAEPLDAVPGRIARVVDACFDQRWPWWPSLLRLGLAPGVARSNKARLGRGSRDVVAAAFAARDVHEVGLVSSPRHVLDHAWLYVGTGRAPARGVACPFEVRAMCRVDGGPRDRPIAAWLELLHELVAAVAAAHGVIVCDDERVVLDEVFLHTTVRNGHAVNPRWSEVQTISGSSAQRDALGATLVRHPRWGTYLKPDHVAAAGGRERLIAACSPALARDVGSLLYLQLSDSPDDAAAAEPRRVALADLLAPITVPPR